MPERQNVPWIQFVAKLLAYEGPASLVGVLMLAASLFSLSWTLLESAGISGSGRILVALAAASAAVAGVVIILFRFFRWTFLFAAVKDYIRRNHLSAQISADTVLVGGGAGGALAVGMVSKALQELGHAVPHSFVIDCQYRGEHDPQTGILLPPGFTLSRTNVFVVHSYLGTGRSLDCIKEVLGLNTVPVFSFVISEALVGREDIAHYLVVGERAIIPWSKASP
jgi:hypothetical protein